MQHDPHNDNQGRGNPESAAADRARLKMILPWLVALAVVLFFVLA